MWKGTVFEHGVFDAALDRCENVPFASIGGLDNRSNFMKPRWIKDSEIEEYFSGYKSQCIKMYGDDWETCSFSWKYIAIINEDKSVIIK
jgi:hypothetical protein